MSDLKDGVEGLGPVMAQAGAGSSAGRVLREAREARRFSHEDVAQYLKYSPRQIEALERDDYDALPAPAVVRGMVRSYAKLLDLDPEPLLASVRDRLAPLPTAMSADAMSVPFPARGANGHRTYWVLSALLVVGAIAFLVDWGALLDRTRGVAESMGIGLPAASAPAPAARESEAQPTTAANSNIELNTQSIASPAEQAPKDTPGATADASPAPVAASLAAPEAAPKPAAGAVRRVQLVFANESWVEVRQADGRVVFSQSNPAGSEKTIEVTPPVRLVIGAAKGVKLFYDGAPVDLSSHTVVDVARLGLE